MQRKKAAKLIFLKINFAAFFCCIDYGDGEI